MDNHNLLRLRFTGFVLILCLMCQSCVSMTGILIVEDTQKENKFKTLQKTYNCSFEDILFLKDYNPFQAFKYGKITGSIDMWLAYSYYSKVHPITWSLVGNYYYGFLGLFFSRRIGL